MEGRQTEMGPIYEQRKRKVERGRRWRKRDCGKLTGIGETHDPSLVPPRKQPAGYAYGHRPMDLRAQACSLSPISMTTGF